MLKITQSQKGDVSIIKLSGKATIENATEITKTLLPFISKVDVILQTAALTKVDLSFIQIISSVFKTCQIEKTKFNLLLGDDQSHLMKKLHDYGLTFSKSFLDSCLVGEQNGIL